MSLSEALGNEKAHYRYGKPSDNVEHIALPRIEIKNAPGNMIYDHGYNRYEL